MPGPGPIPPRWLKCPRKSEGLIGGRFLATKAPLDSKFDDQIPPECQFTPQMLISSLSSYKVKIGMYV